METKETVRVLGICGSPREGNSRFLLSQALEAAQTVDREQTVVNSYSIRGKKFAPCVGCFRCTEEPHIGECVIKDSFQELRDMWLQSDVILYSVPVYHLGIPGQLKCFIDRLGNTINRYYRLQSPRFIKVIGAMAQGTHFAAGQELAVAFLHQHAVLKNCIPVSGDGWESYLGACGWTRNDRSRDAIGTLFESREPDAVLAVNASRTLGQRAVELAFILKTGGRALKDKLSEDASYRPFLDGLRT
jgi:multimeric flavodoxin WrbA